MKHIFGGFALVALVLVWAQSLRQNQAQRANTSGSSLPSYVYLGEGGTYTAAPGYGFVVKRLQPFRLEWEPGPTYAASGRERVWQTLSAADVPPPYNRQEIVVGSVPAGCVVAYAVIDDDVDGRINHFKLNGNIIHTLTQGMVTTGQFTVPAGGTLSYESLDSTGLAINYCLAVLTPTATATKTIMPTVTVGATITATATFSPTATITATPDVTFTPTITSTVTATPETAPTQTPTSTPRPDNTPTPSITPTQPVATVTATPSSTPTKEPRLDACYRINLEVSGEVARAGDYVIQELGGHYLGTWQAEDGWTDSGWVQDIDITYPSVFVEVYYFAPDGSPPLRMNILNPAPDTDYGWLSRGLCHAVEVGWPEMPPADENGADAGSDADDETVQPTTEVIWPGQEPTDTPTPGSALSP